MSKTPKNKKYLELQGVRIYHNKKDNSIQLISTDPDLTGKPFHITLNHGTETEKSIRELLVEKEIITSEQSNPQNTLPQETHNPYLNNLKTNIPWNTIPIGETMNNETVFLNLHQNAHTLIAGMAGSGKTVLLNNLIVHALNHPNHWKISAIDLKKVEFSSLKNYPKNLHSLGLNFNDSMKALEELEKTAHLRMEKIRKQKVHHYLDLKENQGTVFQEPAIMVLIDEAWVLLEKEPETSNENQQRNKKAAQAQEIINQLTRTGRALGIHIIISTQRTDSTHLIPGELKANLSNRIAISKLTTHQSRLTIGTDLATQTPPKPGAAILGVNRNLTPFQIYRTFNTDLQTIT